MSSKKGDMNYERSRKSLVYWVIKGEVSAREEERKGVILEEECSCLSVSRRQGRKLLSPGEVGRPRKSGNGGRPGNPDSIERTQRL